MKWPLGFRNPFHPVKGGYSLFYAIEAMAREKHLYRVAVIDDDRVSTDLTGPKQRLIQSLATAEFDNRFASTGVP